MKVREADRVAERVDVGVTHRALPLASQSRASEGRDERRCHDTRDDHDGRRGGGHGPRAPAPPPIVRIRLGVDSKSSDRT
jgi:hypothetical protein